MKKYLFTLLFVISAGAWASGQTTDALLSNCLKNAGSDSKYLKDFRVQLGKANAAGEMRYKAQISLWKNTKYRFTLCNAENSKGQLILTIKDDTNKQLLSSFDQNTGKAYPFIDFICRKSGIYQINFDFIDGQQGSGIGIVSMIK